MLSVLFYFIFLLQRSWVWFLLLLCAVVSFGAVKTDSWQDVFFFFFLIQKRTNKHSTCFMDSFWHCESHHWNKTSVDYLNTVGRGGREGQCWSMMVGLCKRDSGKGIYWEGGWGGEGRGLKKILVIFFVNTVSFLFWFFCIECFSFR